MGQLRESRWVELNLVSGLGDACLLKRLPFGGKKNAVDGTHDMPVSDSGTHSCESDSGSGTSAAPPHNIFSVVVCEGFPVVS